MTASESVSNNSGRVRVWIEDGVLRYKVYDVLSFDIMLEAERQSISLLRQAKVLALPVVFDVTEVSDTNFSLRPTDLGKLLMGRSHISGTPLGVWVVGAQGKILTLGSIFGKLFLNDLKMVDSLDQALAEARVSAQRKLSIERPPHPHA